MKEMNGPCCMAEGQIPQIGIGGLLVQASRMLHPRNCHSHFSAPLSLVSAEAPASLLIKEDFRPCIVSAQGSTLGHDPSTPTFLS